MTLCTLCRSYGGADYVMPAHVRDVVLRVPVALCDPCALEMATSYVKMLSDVVGTVRTTTLARSSTDRDRALVVRAWLHADKRVTGDKALALIDAIIAEVDDLPPHRDMCIECGRIDDGELDALLFVVAEAAFDSAAIHSFVHAPGSKVAHLTSLVARVRVAHAMTKGSASTAIAAHRSGPNPDAQGDAAAADLRDDRALLMNVIEQRDLARRDRDDTVRMLLRVAGGSVVVSPREMLDRPGEKLVACEDPETGGLRLSLEPADVHVSNMERLTASDAPGTGESA